MLDSNHNNSNCEFAAETVAYLYGEIEAREKIEFETHLQSCSGCSEELAGFGLIRSSIFEWKDEFSALKTPAFNLPIEKAQKFSEMVSVSTRKNLWLDNLRELLSFSPSRAFAAFAALIFCAGSTIFVFNFSGDSNNGEIAESEFNKNVAPVISPTIERQIKQSDEIENARENSSGKPLEPQEQNIKKSEREAIEPTQANAPVVKEAVVKVSSNPRKTVVDNKPSPNSNDSSEKEKVSYKENRKASPVKAQNAPKLIDDEETEDDSVRLADLFDEIDTK